jgi:beta-galactosidase
MDGSRTPRSDMASRIAKWANAPEQKPLWDARPVKGDIGLLVIPEAQAWDYLLNAHHKPETYREAMWGAYRGFLDNGLQPDWVHVDDIGDYDAIYAPYPIMLTSEHAKRLAEWVAGGGTLISEATPGYFGDRGKVGTVQPHNGLDVVFGARESDVEFMPDIGDRIAFDFGGKPVKGGGFLQSYTPTTGKPLGKFADGRIAAIENAYGQGRTLLIGTHPGIAYFKTSNAENLRYFADVFAGIGRKQQVSTGNPNIVARLHRDAAGNGALWLVNFERQPEQVRVVLAPEHSALRATGSYWGDHQGLTATVPARDVLVLKLEG